MLAVHRLAEVPLALHRDVVAAVSQQRGQRVDPGRQFGLVAAPGPDPQRRLRTKLRARRPRGISPLAPCRHAVRSAAGALRRSGHRSPSVRVSVTPWREGRLPVIRQARLGEHIAEAVKARVKDSALARSSRLVGAQLGQPAGSSGQCWVARCWSVISSTRLGRSGSPAARCSGGVCGGSVHAAGTISVRDHGGSALSAWCGAGHGERDARSSLRTALGRGLASSARVRARCWRVRCGVWRACPRLRPSRSSGRPPTSTWAGAIRSRRRKCSTTAGCTRPHARVHPQQGQRATRSGTGSVRCSAAPTRRRSNRSAPPVAKSTSPSAAGAARSSATPATPPAALAGAYEKVIGAYSLNGDRHRHRAQRAAQREGPPACDRALRAGALRRPVGGDLDHLPELPVGARSQRPEPDRRRRDGGPAPRQLDDHAVRLRSAGGEHGDRLDPGPGSARRGARARRTASPRRPPTKRPGSRR